MASAGTNCFGKATTLLRYYFDQKAKECKPFEYFGCSGNSNNFRSKEHCENYCLANADKGKETCCFQKKTDYSNSVVPPRRWVKDVSMVSVSVTFKKLRKVDDF